MDKYSCKKCSKSFFQKSQYEEHISFKSPCEIQIDNIKAVAEKLIETNIIKISNNTESNIIINSIDKMNKLELLEKCKELSITKCRTKNKSQLIELINSKEKLQLNKNNQISNDNNNEVDNNIESPFSLFEECLKNVSIKDIADKLNICTGTIRRWIELKNVPNLYIFDLYKILSKDIDYTKYTSSLKDQFFTPICIAKKCWDTFNREVKINIEDYTFIEPSAGDGNFLHILPKGSIGLDIEPRTTEIQTQDYLNWKPTDVSKKYIVFGNPPFGLRGHLALNFINHSYNFADYVCFILPQLFESDGKGSPRKRVKKYNLIYSEKLSAKFYNPENKEVNVNCVFQIWSKYSINTKYTINIISEDKMKVYSLSDGGTVSTTRNKIMIDKCDVYIPSTCFGKDNMKIYERFEDLPGKKGYGIVFFTDKEKMINLSKSIDWSSISFLSTNSAYNLRTSIITSMFV